MHAINIQSLIIIPSGRPHHYHNHYGSEAIIVLLLLGAKLEGCLCKISLRIESISFVLLGVWGPTPTSSLRPTALILSLCRLCL
ncbi:hypothetical protein PRUPE_2G075300 [Prunus persica]|uniref:Uncharacterized protein n=1 Tax=Prunus persica TaxID=3760 RepID=A0A251QCN2_PRUPE|nr:hypothetical protein PRUPE_2G075300 [Prunus persica]